MIVFVCVILKVSAFNSFPKICVRVKANISHVTFKIYINAWFSETVVQEVKNKLQGCFQSIISLCH